MLTNMSENLKEEEKHLHKVLQSNGDNATIRAGSKELPSKDHTNTEQEKGLILTILYIAELSESIQRVCRDFDEKVSAIAEHAWQQHHHIKWEEVRVVDRASKNHELKIKKLYTYR